MEINKSEYTNLVTAATSRTKTTTTKGNATSDQAFQNLFNQKTAQASENNRVEYRSNRADSKSASDSSRDVQSARTKSEDKVENDDNLQSSDRSQSDDKVQNSGNKVDNKKDAEDQKDTDVKNTDKVDSKSNGNAAKAEKAAKTEETVPEEKAKPEDQLLTLLASLLSGKISAEDAVKQAEGTPGAEVLKIVATALKQGQTQTTTTKTENKVDLEAQLLNAMLKDKTQATTVDTKDNGKDAKALMEQILNLVTEKGSITEEGKAAQLSQIQQSVSEYFGDTKKVDLSDQKQTTQDTKIQDLVNAIQDKLKENGKGSSNPVGEKKDINTALNGALSAKSNKNVQEMNETKGKEVQNAPEEKVSSAEIGSTTQSSSTDSEEQSSSSKQNLSSEDKLLKSLTTNSGDNKINKITTFMTQFNAVSARQDLPVEEVGDKLLVTKANFAQDMIKAVKYMESANLKDLTVKIAPKELGEVIIKLTVEEGVMKANISATNKDAYSLLNANLADMNSKLNNNDIKIQGFTVNIYNGDTTFFKDGSQQQNQSSGQQSKKSNSVLGIDEEVSAANNTIEEDGNVNILA